MKHKYVKITTNATQGSYIQPMSELANALDAEFDDAEFMDAGFKVCLELVDMTDEEYEKLPEFQGW